MTRRESSEPEVKVECGHACRIRWGDTYVAYHAPAVVENGWEPYDQPSSAAYLPAAFSALVHARCGGGRVLVRRRARTRLPANARVTICAAFAGAGAPPKAAQLAIKLLTRGVRGTLRS